MLFGFGGQHLVNFSAFQCEVILVLNKSTGHLATKWFLRLHIETEKYGFETFVWDVREKNYTTHNARVSEVRV